jgi:hypothetical protein
MLSNAKPEAVTGPVIQANGRLSFELEASGDKLRAAIDMGRKQYQPKQLKSCHFHCFL